MNAIKTTCVTALVASGAALLAAQPALSRDRDPMARSLFEVETIRVEGDICPSRVSSVLNDRGFLATRGPGRTDAVLELDVETDGSLMDHESIEEGRYVATLRGARDRVLFSTSGYEENINLGRLCDEIGEEIANDLERSMG